MTDPNAKVINMKECAFIDGGYIRVFSTKKLMKK